MLTELPRKQVLSSSKKERKPFRMGLTYDDVLLLPAYSEITPPETDLRTFLTKNVSLKIPLIASPMDTVCEREMALAMSKLGGLGIIHRNLSIEKQVEELRWVLESGEYAAVAVGVGSDFHERVSRLFESGATLFCIDAAHGHSKQVMEAIAHFKDKYPDCEIIAGNVATYEGASKLFEAGADAVRVGIGPGAICTTRVVAGVGVPQLTAVMECAEAAKEHGRSIIADGGIKVSGDIVKAIGAGASTVMLGSLLAGTDKAPGKWIEGKRYKEYRGMGSIQAMKRGSAARYGVDLTKPIAPQGVEGKVPYKGSVNDQVYLLMEGLRAGMAYIGAQNIEEVQQKASFIQQTPAALRESYPHSIEEL